MAVRIRRIHYYSTTVRDAPGEGYRVLSSLAEQQVNLVAFTGVPIGSNLTQLTLFPDDESLFVSAAGKSGLKLEGPHFALLVQGDDQFGAIAEIHRRLSAAKVNVYASNGVADGVGGYGYVLHVRPEHFENAVQALGL
jgi:hypothetical protein